MDAVLSHEALRVAIELVGLLGALVLLVGRINAVRHEFNSKMDRLLELTAKASRAQGNLEGRAEANREREGKQE